MFPESACRGELLLPDRVAAKYRPDFGVVCGVGVGVDLEVGDVVAVRPYDGLWLCSREFSWVPEARQVRLYGVACTWEESIVARIDK